MHLWIITVYQRFQDIKTYIELYSKITEVYNDIFIISSLFFHFWIKLTSQNFESCNFLQFMAKPIHAKIFARS